MVRDQHLNTRVSQEAYKVLLLKCADEGCTPYRYVRQLIHADAGLDPEGEAVQDSGEVPKQTELIVEDEHVEGRIRITG